MKLTVNNKRLWDLVTTLSGYTLPDRPWTRRAFTDLYQDSRAWLSEEFKKAGLTVRLDEAGNLIGSLEGRNPDAKPLVVGSHTDTVVDGGRFDGIIGVLAGIEIAHLLQDQQIQLEHPLEVIDFLSEEPSDYGVSCVGSRAMSGVLSADMLAQPNELGERLAEGIDRMGGRAEDIAAADRSSTGIAAFVELHIEQGPVLEDRNLPIGVVTDIVGIRRVLLRVQGQPDHAGTTPMDLRRDALVGAAQLVVEANNMARAQSNNPHYVVATVGRIHMTPNVPNSVPGLVEMVLEVRSNHDEVLAQFPEQLVTNVQGDLERLNLCADFSELTRSKSTPCTELVMQAIEDESQHLGLQTMRMPSGAGHDAAYLQGLGPMGMVFVPCLKGRSHCHEEWLEPEQLAIGVEVLYKTLLNLDGQLK